MAVIEKKTETPKEEGTFTQLPSGLKIGSKKPTINGKEVMFLGAHPSNTPGVKWTEKQKLVWQKLDKDYGHLAGAEYSTHTGFKDASGKLRTTFLVRTIDEIQLWALDKEDEAVS